MSKPVTQLQLLVTLGVFSVCHTAGTILGHLTTSYLVTLTCP